jgi:hypothetical protein
MNKKFVILVVIIIIIVISTFVIYSPSFFSNQKKFSTENPKEIPKTQVEIEEEKELLLEQEDENEEYPWSRVVCLKPPLTVKERDHPLFQKTCKVKNLYVINGTFYVIVSTKNQITEEDLLTSINTLQIFTWKPSLLKFESKEHLKRHFKEKLKINFTKLNETFYYYYRAVGYHMIHSIVDDTFSTFHALHIHKQKKILEGNKRFSVIIDDVQIHKVIGWYPNRKVLPKMEECYVGLNADRFFVEDLAGKNQIMKNFIYGSYGLSIHFWNSTYHIPGYDERILFKFRNFFIKNLAKVLPNKFQETKKDKDKLVVSIFPKGGFGLPTNAIDEIKKQYPKFEVNIIDFGKLQNISDEIQVHLKTDISIGLEGSNTLLTIFQKPLTNYISLGRMLNLPGVVTNGHQADFLYASTDYLRVLYFENYTKNPAEFSGSTITYLDEFMKLFKSALTPFTIPRSVDDNLSARSKICKRAMKEHPVLVSPFFEIGTYGYNAFCAYLMCAPEANESRFKIKFSKELRNLFFC